ncbi:hypothetical protein FQR65_LT02131 [Abscondita terminalis]|nr:hypothetical protein FQR65_LT02131 [Abscondita terminalis]
MVTPPPPPPPPSQPPVDPPQPEIIDLDNFDTPMHVPDYNINASCSNQSIGKSWRKLKEVYRKSSDEEDVDEIEKDEEDEVAEKANYRNKIMKNIEEKWKQLEVQQIWATGPRLTKKTTDPDLIAPLILLMSSMDMVSVNRCGRKVLNSSHRTPYIVSILFKDTISYFLSTIKLLALK